ncbi:hypothetical protein Tco_0581201 [Tanacetum coccineum]
MTHSLFNILHKKDVAREFFYVLPRVPARKAWFVQGKPLWDYRALKLAYTKAGLITGPRLAEVEAQLASGKKDTSRSTAVKNAAAAVKERSEELNVEAVMKELKSLEIADVINHEKKNKKKNKTMGTEIDNSVICKTLKVVTNKLKKDAVKKDFDDVDDVIIMGKGNKKK